MSRKATGALILLVGAMATGAVTALAGLPGPDAVVLAAYTGAGALAAGTAGGLLLHFSRRLSIGLQAALVSMTAVAAVAGGTVLAANAMFISSHDLGALAVVLVAGATLGVFIALLLGGRISRESRSLAAVARRIGDGDFTVENGPPPSAEFAALARELEEMSVRLSASLQRERALEKSRRELIAWVSHDLRTPLAGIRAMAEALEDGIAGDDETVSRYHESIRAEVDRLSELVDDLFELSRINAGTLQLEMDRVSLGDLVSDALSSASVVARSKGVRLEGELDGTPPELRLAPSEMSRVLRNLLENAIRHTPHEGVVRISMGIERGHAFVRVADGCGGIPDADIERVFDVAFRGESARSPANNGGAGLGLAIARGIVEAHHGEISVANDVAGCAFTVRLPMSGARGA